MLKLFSDALDISSNPLRKRKKLLIFWGIYSVLFAAIFLIGYSVFRKDGLSFIWNNDGLNQQIIYTRYFAEYWRSFFRNILSGNFTFQMFDFRIGMGDDLITTKVNSIGLGDFFTMLSVFVPSRFIIHYYHIIIVLRPFVAGLTFSLLCMYAKQKNWAILLGSLIYTFSGYALWVGLAHPIFIIPMIYVPIMFIGLDQVLQKKKPFLFIVSVFMMALNGFFFLYIITIFLIICSIIRIHHLYGKDFWKNLLPIGVKASLCYFLGIMMTAVLFLPTTIGFFNSSRSGHVNTDSLWLDHSYSYIFKFVFSIGVIDSFYYLGLAAIILLALAALVVNKDNKKDSRHLFTLFFVTLLLYIIPFGGFLINGFGYVSQRWIFMFVLFLSFITVYMLPKMISAEKRERIAFTVISCIYAFTSFFIYNGRSLYSLMALGMLLLTLVCITFTKRKQLTILLLTILIAVNLTANAWYMYDPSLRGYSSEYLLAGEYEEKYESLPSLSDTVRTSDDSFYRLDTPPTVLANAPIYHNYNGLTMYWSMINKNSSQGLKDLDVFTMNFSFWINRGFDGRTALNTLSSVKYYAEVEEQTTPLPYGYSLLEQLGNHRTYENNYALPLGYTYDKVISSKDYQGLSSLDKQEAMLQAVALEDEYVDTTTDELSFTTSEIPYTINAENLTWENRTLKTSGKNATMTLTFEGMDNCETYVRLSGFDHKSLLNSTIQFDTDNISSQVIARFSKDTYFFNRHDYLCNLGYSEEGQTSVTITFQQSATYSLDDIQLFCYPMTNYPEQVEALKSEVLENIIVSDNHVTGEITVSKDKFLVLSIPYSDGWNAKIDGEDVELLQANTMFMALPLSPGHHTITLDYCTPGIKTGAILSIAGIVIFALLLILSKRQKKKKITS